jgi:hypothetical protein
MARLLEPVLTQVLEAQVTEQLQAPPYQRTEQRQGYRTGCKPPQVTSRVGNFVLRIPQVREGQFSTELFARYQRREQALVLTLMEMGSMASPRARWFRSGRTSVGKRLPGRPSPTSRAAQGISGAGTVSGRHPAALPGPLLEEPAGPCPARRQGDGGRCGADDLRAAPSPGGRTAPARSGTSSPGALAAGGQGTCGGRRGCGGLYGFPA